MKGQPVREAAEGQGLRECHCTGQRLILDNSGVEWVRSKRLAELTGLSIKAIDRKRERDIWREGMHFQLRDGGVYYSIKAYNAWASMEERSRALPKRAMRVYAPRRAAEGEVI